MKKNMKKNMLWMLLSLMAAAIMMPLSATAQTRIAVVSDIHVMAPRLLPEEAKGEGTPWDTYYKGQRKMLEQSAGLFDQFVTTLTSKPDNERPHVLLITGDLTKDGELVSHKYVRGTKEDRGLENDNGLKKLEDAGIQVYVIPGNHDFGAEGNHTQFKADGTTENAPVLSTAGFASFYTGYGYGIDNDNNFVQDPNGSLSYVAEIADGLYLLAIDSHNGSVYDATLTWICDQAQVIRGAGKRVIAMMHHPLFPHIEGADMFITTYTVANYEKVRKALINAGVNVILTGHFHTSDIAKDWDWDNNDQTKYIYDINTGSLISYPCDYRILTLTDNTTLSVETQSLTPTGWTADGWADECETWLHDRVEAIAKKKMIEVAGEDAAKSSEEYINNIAELAANLFILHAKGNENSQTNNLGETYEGYKDETIMYGIVHPYKIAFTYGGITDESIYSILTDISNYVDGEPMSDHENRTDDRTLSGITLTTLEPSGTLNLSDDKDIRTAINCYHGKPVNVRINTSGINAARLSNRASSLYKDGAWNTICLPFDVTDGDLTDNVSFSGTPLEGAKVKTLESSSFNSSTGELTLTFSDDLVAIEAGKPYILKWQNNGEQPINSLSFDNVIINKAIKAVPTSANLNDAPASVTFVGTYNPKSFNDDDDSILLIGSETQGEIVKSTLFYPKAGASIGVCRAYFQLADDYTAGEPDTPGPGGGGIRNFVLNFGDDDSATGIIAIGDSQLSTLNAQRSEWFTLDGRRLAAKPTAKGLYIHAGRKVVIK